MKYKLKYLVIFVWVGMAVNVVGQDLKQFSDTREGFLNDMTTLLTQVNSKEYQQRAEDLLASFMPKWFSERFQKEEKDRIIFIANQMLKAKMRTYPHFYQFLVTLNDMAYTTQPKRSVMAWLQGLEPIIRQSSTKVVEEYLSFTSGLLTQGILFNTRTMWWKVERDKYYFHFDTVPLVVFERLDLICATKKDSSIIEGTEGVFHIFDKTWYGKKGTVNWSRLGLDHDKVYADIIGSYRIHLKESNYGIDSVSFHHKYYLNEPILGSLSDRILSSPPGHKSSYPKFVSFFRGFRFEDVFEGVHYEGGISMEGLKLVGSGRKDQLATLEFMRNNRLFARVKSASFVFQDKRINSIRAAIAIFHESDSIYHPGLNMKYNDENQTLTLYRSNKGLARSPFYDTYHQIDLYCELMKWDLNADQIRFEMVRGLSKENIASFESANYYSDYEYYKLQGIDPINPLERVENYTKRYKTNVIRLNAFAAFINKSIDQASAMLFNLASMGFLVYDVQEKKATVKQKLFDYLEARTGRIDYDVMKFISTTNLESNAILSLNDFDLKINGVPEISLSDSQNVTIYPSNEEIVLKKNRDFTFSGVVEAGLFDFYASDCSFEYDSFRINLPVIDSLSFFVQVVEDKPREEPRYIRVKNVISKLNGNILIDLPMNKSGIKSNKDYPIFNSNYDAFVFYDKGSIRQGVYGQERFYYHVDPFTIARLDNFSTDDIKFTGYLASDSTFPYIDEDLVVLPDYSLGFVHQIPEKGYDIYRGKGKFHETIKLSNQGLIGTGWMSYLTSFSESGEYIFYLDSMRTQAGNFQVFSQMDEVEFPMVQCEVVDQFWLVDTNVMYVTMIDNPFQMYENNSLFQGQLILSPKGMTGNGLFGFSKAEIESKLFNFNYNSLQADTSDFQLLTLKSDQLAISTTRYRSFIDFDKSEGHFASLDRQSVVDFPFNNYISSMDEMIWDMDQQRITLMNNMSSEVPYLDDFNLYDLIDFDFSGSEFISTRADQDSLAFYCQKATYDMINYQIFAEGVKIIRVADAAIFPGDGKITILEDAVMKSLENAYIIADTSNKLHTFYNAFVNIYSRNNYVARGSYDYIDAHDTPQEINMGSITVDNSGTTHANGEIPEGSVFFLSPHFYYTGRVSLVSHRKNLQFNGGFTMSQDCYFANTHWAAFDTVINPQNVIIPVAKSIYDINGSRLQVGLNFSRITHRFYPALFLPKENPSDVSLISSYGILDYDPLKHMYRIGNPDRLNNRVLTGNTLELDTEKCILKGKGALDLGVDLDPVQVLTFGGVNHLIIPDSTTFRTSMILDFYFDDDLLESMADSLNASNLRGVDLTHERYKMMLISLLGEKDAYEIINDLSLYGNIRKFPDDLNHTLIFTDVKFKWNPRSSSYVSYGKIGLGSIYKNQVNKYVDGIIEIENKRSANAIHLYLKVSDHHWYFFSYRNKVMQAYSSSQGFNERLTGLEQGNRTVNLPGEDAPYEYVISTRRKQVDFVRKIEGYGSIR